MATVLLFENQTSDASSSAATFIKQTSGQFVTCTGDFGGGTLTVEMRSAGQWAPLQGGEYTEPEARLLAGTSGGRTLRCTLAGATAANLTVEVTE